MLGWASLGCDDIVIGVGCSSAPPFFPYALTVNVIGLLLITTVFNRAYAFNGDLNQWGVAKVTTMYESKSISILEKDLAGREFLQ